MDDTVDEAATRTADDFETLFAEQFGRLARLVRRVVNDTAEAEDLAADVLWKCFRKRPEAINLEGWLVVSPSAPRSTASAGKLAAIATSPSGRLAPRVAKPDELLQRDRDGERVRQVLAAIKPQFATLLVLRTEGLDYRELASALGVKPGSVGTLLARAESSFRKEYERRHGPQ